MGDGEETGADSNQPEAMDRGPTAISPVACARWLSRRPRHPRRHSGGHATWPNAPFAITGTKWNGHRFFGMRRRDGVRASERKDDAKATDGRERPSALVRGNPIKRPLE